MAFGHWDAPPVGGAPLTSTLGNRLSTPQPVAALGGEYLFVPRACSPNAVVGEVEHVRRAGRQTFRVVVADLCAFVHPSADRMYPHWSAHLFTRATRRYDAGSKTTEIVSDPELQAGQNAARLRRLLKLREGDFPVVHPELAHSLGAALVEAGLCSLPMLVHVHASIEQRQVELGTVFHDDD